MRCRFCGVKSKKTFCDSNCEESLEILKGKKIDPLASELISKVGKYGRNKYTSIRWLRLRKKVFKRDVRMCARCKKSINVILHVDHVTPVAWATDQVWRLDNLQILCEKCNLKKRASNDIDWKTGKSVSGKKYRFVRLKAWLLRWFNS